MASVRITRELRRDITNRASNAFETANPHPTASTEFQQLMQHAIPRMPSQIALGKIKQIYDNEISGHKSFNNKEHAVHVTNKSEVNILLTPDNGERAFPVKVVFAAPVQVYDKETSVWHDQSKVIIEDLAVEDQPEVRRLTAELADRITVNQQAARDYRHAIEDLLDNCNTLKQLLEIWPAAENLVPQELVSKMHEKVTRQQKARAVREKIEFDATAANQIVLTAKLMGTA